MGCRNGNFTREQDKAASESLTDVLLFTTMCIIGCPVDVHVKDGSIYSGTFYTACLEDDYAVVLKKARMTRKGNREANVPNGSLIETLIIQADNLVQVVAKDVLLPAEGIPGNSGADNDCALGAVAPEDVSEEIEENPSQSHKFTAEHDYINCTSVPSLLDERKAGGSPEGNQSEFKVEPRFQGAEESDEIHASRSSVDECENLLNCPESDREEAGEDDFQISSFEASINVKDPKHERPSSDNSQSDGALSSGISAPACDFCPRSSSTLTKSVPPKMAKGFKLNPKAKVFSPSAVLHRPVTPPALATLASTTYMPNSLPVVPIVSTEPENDTSSFSYCSSAPAKYLAHNNLVYGSGHGDQQYSQPILAYMGSMAQPVRYATQYGHLQPGAAYVHPNSQNVMGGRFGPLVYVHPVSNEVATYTSGLSQGPPHPVLTQHPGNVPKHQAMQIYMTPPPFMTNGQQPVTSYIPMSQTVGPVLPVMGAFAVPISDGSLVTKLV